MRGAQAGSASALIGALALMLSGCSRWGWGGSTAAQLGLDDATQQNSPTLIDGSP